MGDIAKVNENICYGIVFIFTGKLFLSMDIFIILTVRFSAYHI